MLPRHLDDTAVNVNGRPWISRPAGRMLRNRRLVRGPILLYRLRLGFVFGARMVLLEHIGRRSGARRQVVLEVIERSPRGIVVVSGFGARAQWFRNLLADPRGWVTVGSRRPQPVRAVLLSPAEAGAVMRTYAEQHPRAWANLRPILEDTLGTSIGEGQSPLPLVRLEPVRP